MKKFLAKLWNGIKRLFEGLEGTVKRVIPVAINIVELVKTWQDSPMDDVITQLIPGNVDDKINAKIKAFLPKLLLELRMTEAIANIPNTNDQLKAILAELKLSNKDDKDVFYHGLASKILEKLSDGKFSWSDAVAVSEYYYQNNVKK